MEEKILGEFLTPVQIFEKFILPEIKDKLYNYVWVDLFCGEGNLILPMLKVVPVNKRIEFFNKHIFLFDIQEKMIAKSIKNAEKYGIPREIAEKNIIQRDTIKNFPEFLVDLPIYHITNPPYLYISYIVRYQKAQEYLKYFKGYQDLYQFALINDLRHNIKKMIYIIPSSFLFGRVVSNKIRDDLLKFYTIKKAIIFERKIFKHTGTNVVICFFERKKQMKEFHLSFEGIKFNKKKTKRRYILSPENHYHPGSEFDKFIKKFRAKKPLKVRFSFDRNEEGNFTIEVIDVNDKYKRKKINVSKKIYKKVKSNILFLRTVDTGSLKGRVGLYLIKKVYGVDGIFVSKAKYRTQPVQVFIEPHFSINEQLLLMSYFNLILEYFREKTDSEFMTTYKYSNSEYTRKYLGLSQAKMLIQTFPWLDLNAEEKRYFKSLIDNKNIEEIIKFLEKRR